MRIVYVGNYSQSFCTETHLARELESLGHDVCRLQEPIGGGDREFLRLIECEADGAALVLWTRTWGLPAEATATWRRLEARGVTTASYHLDLCRGLAREENMATDPIWTTQHVFTPDGNPESEAFFAERGINHHWSPPAVVSDECTRGTWREEFAVDVVFVGSRGYHSEWPWRGQLIDWLETTYGPRFRLHSGDQPGGPTRGQRLNDLYASANVVVGDSCFARPDTRYFSDRPFETWGRGGALVFPRVDLLAEMVGPYPDYMPGDFDELRMWIDHALLDPHDHFAKAAEQLHERVKAEHTYKHRLAVAINTMRLA